MKTRILSLLITLFITFLLNANNKDDWGKTGHRTVGEIANNHLSKSIKRKISDLLNGQSLAMVSTFADHIKSDKRYKDFYTWHYINLNDDETYESSKKNPKGDLVTGIEKCKKVLLDKNSSKEDKAFYLKMLAHLIGDLHQPLHVGRVSDKGGNTFQVKWFNKKTNLHRVWDSQMIDNFKMTYTELASNANKLSEAQIKSMQEGTIIDWVNETKFLAQKVYNSAETDENLRYRYMYDYFETVRTQLQKGGVRLAKILSEVLTLN